MRSFPIFLASFFLFFSFTSIAVAQPMPRSVVGSAGTYFADETFGDLHWTVGEVAVSTLENGVQLAEGFHQGYYELIVSAPAPRPADWSARVFPNPVATRLQLRTNETFIGLAILYDQLGRPITQVRLLNGQAEIDTSSLPAGTYWLRLRSALGPERSFQVQKIRR